MSLVHMGENNSFYGLTHSKKTKDIISKKNSKEVYQYTINGELIMSWCSLSKCSIDTGISISYLSTCIKKGKICKNYRFSYE